MYTRVLLAFRLGGDTSTARRELAEAVGLNPHVPQWLLAQEPFDLPPHYSPGSVEEAMTCAVELGGAFKATPGALDWLAENGRVSSRSTHRIYKQRKRRSR